MQAELHVTEQLSFYAQSQVTLQEPSGDVDFNSTRVGRVNFAGRTWDALWMPISVGVLIHIGAGGDAAPKRPSPGTTPQLAKNLRDAAAAIHVEDLATDPDVARPELVAWLAAQGPEGRYPELSRFLIERILDVMTSGAAAGEARRELYLDLPPGAPAPPSSFGRAVEKIVSVISIGGHSGRVDLGLGLEQFTLFVRQNNPDGSRELVCIIAVPGLGRAAGEP